MFGRVGRFLKVVADVYLMNVPFWYSSKATRSSSWVFMTMARTSYHFDGLGPKLRGVSLLLFHVSSFSVIYHVGVSVVIRIPQLRGTA